WRKLAFPRIVIWRQGPVLLRFSLHQDANLPVLKWTSTGLRTEAAQGVSLQRANFVPIARTPLPRTSEVSSVPTLISTLHDWVDDWVDSSAHTHFSQIHAGLPKEHDHFDARADCICLINSFAIFDAAPLPSKAVTLPLATSLLLWRWAIE